MTDNEVEIPSIEDLIGSALGEKPDEFAARFNELMRTRLATAVDDKKKATAASMFGVSPDDVVDSIAQAHDETDDETPPEPEEKDNGTAT